MIAFILSFICFLITVPLSFIVMSAELKKRADKLKESKEKGPFKAKRTNDLLQNLGSKKDKKGKDNKKNEKREAAKKVIKEGLLLFLKGLLAFFRSLGLMLSALGSFGILIVAVIAIVVVMSMAGILTVMNEEGGLISDKDTQTTTQQQQQARTEEETEGSPTQTFTDNSNWVNCCRTVYDWYYHNIKTYCQQDASHEPSTAAGRGYYDCPLFPGTKGCGDDCSSYVSNALVYAGFLPSGSVNCFSSKNFWGAERTSQLDAYFNNYTYEDFKNGTYKPRAGDIVAFSGHVEILADVVDGPVYVYSWGRVQNKNPAISGRGNNLNTYFSKSKLIWSLKDDVLPPSYLNGK